MPQISVIICTWNRANLLGETLNSLAQQSGLGANDVEVIVVDNNSIDSTRLVVQAARANWSLGVLKYEFEPRQGKQFALNRGIRVALGDVLAFTDDDIKFQPDWLARAIELFGNERVDLAGGRTYVAWGPSGRPPWFADDMTAILGGVDLGGLRLDPGPPSYAPSGANLIARRLLFDQVGGFSEAHYRHMDFEFGMRCHNNGVRVVYDPSLVVIAPVDEQCLTLRYFRRWAFKAGVGASRDAGPSSNAARHLIPLWVYRQLVEDGVAVCATFFTSLTPTRFSRELRMWRRWGSIASAWHAWLWPARHDDWVKKKSQKSKNLY